MTTNHVLLAAIVVAAVVAGGAVALFGQSLLTGHRAKPAKPKKPITFWGRVTRKLHYPPFWEDLGRRAVITAALADSAYVTIGSKVIHFSGLPFKALATVAVLAALTSAAKTTLNALPAVPNFGGYPDVIVRVASTFLGTFAGVALVGVTPDVGFVSVVHALDVAGGAAAFSLFTNLVAMKPAARVMRPEPIRTG